MRLHVVRVQQGLLGVAGLLLLVLVLGGAMGMEITSWVRDGLLATHLCLLCVPLLVDVAWHGPPSDITNTQDICTKGGDGGNEAVVARTLKPQPTLTAEEARAFADARAIVDRETAKFMEKNKETWKGVVPMASERMQRHLQRALKMFETNMSANMQDVSSEGRAWKLQHHDAKRGVEIYSADFPNHPCKRWKIMAVLQCDMVTGYDAIFDPAVRKTWDLLVKDVDMLDIQDCAPEIGDGLAITSIVTNAAMGGLVTSRAMLDLAIQRCHPRGGIVIANCSCPSDFDEFALAPKVPGCTLATTHMGSGCSLLPIPGRPGYLQYCLVSTIELGGWLPPSLVNSAMTMSLKESTEQMQDFLASSSSASPATFPASTPGVTHKNNYP